MHTHIAACTAPWQPGCSQGSSSIRFSSKSKTQPICYGVALLQLLMSPRPFAEESPNSAAHCRRKKAETRGRSKKQSLIKAKNEKPRLCSALDPSLRAPGCTADTQPLITAQRPLPHSSAARINPAQPVRPPTEAQHYQSISKYADLDLEMINCSLWGGYRGSLHITGGWRGDGCWQLCQGCCSQAQILFLLRP